jgi:5-methylcytosine-specific restriction enzyme subunit McrC
VPSQAEPLVLDVEEWGKIEVDPAHLTGASRAMADVPSEKYFSTSLVGGRLILQAKGYVGVIPVSDELTLNIVPRVAFANLTRVMEVADCLPAMLPDVLRRYGSLNRMTPSILTAFALGLDRATTQIKAEGLMKDYVRREEDSSVPRGRILVGPTMQLDARGQRHRARSSWFQRTADIAVNQCLLHAIQVLSALNKRLLGGAHRTESRLVARLLNNSANRLVGVSTVPASAFVSDPYVTGRVSLPDLRSYYSLGLDLARLVVRGEGADVFNASGRLELGSLVIDLSDLFQRYVRRVLAAAASSRAWPSEVKDGNVIKPEGARKHLLDTPLFDAKPDVVLQRAASGETDVVIEVKYIPATGPPSIDGVHQALAYGFSYTTKHVVIAQPSATDVAGRFHRLGTIGDVTIHHFVMDLGGPLDAEENRLANAIAKVAGYE